MIKNANDLLGFLIKNRNGKNEVRASVILENAGMDSISLNYLIKQLKEQCFIIYSYDTIGITDLGLRNYISNAKIYHLGFKTAYSYLKKLNRLCCRNRKRGYYCISFKYAHPIVLRK